MTQPAISRQVTALEERLGARLVHRTTQSLTLTHEGRQLVERARELVSEADSLLDWAAQSRARPVGRVRLSASVPFGLLLAANIHRLLDLHEDLSVELVLRDTFGNLIEEGLDAQVRIGEASDSSLISRRIGWTRHLLVASPEYVSLRRKPAHPSELSEHWCVVHQREGGDDVWWFRDRTAFSGDEISVAVKGRLWSNNAAAVHRAALAGQGIAYVSVLLASDDIAAGKLVELLPEYPCRRSPIYVDYPSQRHLPLRVRAVLDFLALMSKEMHFTVPD
jgi:DNA-binding transcriptional LysR family regulator